MMKRVPIFVALLLSACFSACSLAQPIRRPEPGPTPPREYIVVEVARGLQFPWSLAFLPDGRLLVTERPGRLRVVDRDGRLSAPIAGLPPVYAQGQGGLLDVALDPAFASNHRVYLSYAEPDAFGKAGTAVARAVLGDGVLTGLEVIYRQEPKAEGGAHFGSRLAFAPDGTLFITQGDRYLHRDGAQDLSNDFGKIVRLNPNGSVPLDNPFVRTAGARPEIWSYGHRNLQGAAIEPATDRLWTHEHGAQGGDEINHPEAGRNYGWPVITWGIDYDGSKIGEGTSKAGMEQPVHYWTPSIAPSGMAFYSGGVFPQWRGNLFVGSLKFGFLDRIELKGDKVMREQRLLSELGERIRDVRQGPDGCLYVLTDNVDGRVLRLQAPGRD
ncbi:MAG: hydrophobic compound transporter HcuB [Nevskia sp.]